MRLVKTQVYEVEYYEWTHENTVGDILKGWRNIIPEKEKFIQQLGWKQAYAGPFKREEAEQYIKELRQTGKFSKGIKEEPRSYEKNEWDIYYNDN